MIKFDLPGQVVVPTFIPGTDDIVAEVFHPARGATAPVPIDFVLKYAFSEQIANSTHNEVTIKGIKTTIGYESKMYEVIFLNSYFIKSTYLNPTAGGPEPGRINAIRLTSINNTFTLKYNPLQPKRLISRSEVLFYFSTMEADGSGPSGGTDVYLFPDNHMLSGGVPALAAPQYVVVSQIGFVPADTLLITFCSGKDLWGRYADGAGGTYDQELEKNSTICGYVAPPASGTELSRFCKGVDQWGNFADGSGGSTEQLIQVNSTTCGYVAPPEHGVELSRFCKGFDQWGNFADGLGGSYEQVIQVNSTTCGYVAPPEFGTELERFCKSGTHELWGRYANGIGGIYEQVIDAKSVACGYTPPVVCDEYQDNDNATQKKIKKWLKDYVSENRWGYSYCDSRYCVREFCTTSNSRVTLVSFNPTALDSEVRDYINSNGWESSTAIYRISFNRNDANDTMKAFADDGGKELCPYSAEIGQQNGYIENHGRWIYREETNSTICGGALDCTADASKYNADWYKRMILKYVPCEQIPPQKGPSGGYVPRTFEFTDSNTKYTLVHIWGEEAWGLPPGSVLITINNDDTSAEYAQCADNSEQMGTRAAVPVYYWRQQWWAVCKEESVATISRTCCTCGSGSTGVLMDNFVFAISDTWFNETLIQYVETGAFAARQLPSNGPTPNPIPDKWILTLLGSGTTPTKPEVKRKMDVVLAALKEFLDDTNSKYKNFQPAQTKKIIAGYNGDEFAFKLEDCNGSIATFVITREICPKAGQELNTYCVEFDRWKTYTDGNCGQYNQLVKANSEDCGYVPCEPAGRKMETYCEGFDQWAFFSDGNCGKTPVKLHENSEDCGYVPCDKKGTVTGTKCKGFDLYDIVADGNCGTEDVLNTPKSPTCGYVPCEPAGIEKRRYCEGKDQYAEYTDGNCGVTRQLIMTNSPDCGYVPCEPAGIEKRRYCEGKDQYAEYTDGNCGVTRQLIMTNSPDCGYTPPPDPTCPDRGTPQRTYCSGTTKMGVYADGTCGTYEEAILTNAPECGYIPPNPDPTSRLVDSWWHFGVSATGIQTVPFEFPNASMMGTATITFDPDGTTWIKPVSIVRPTGGGDNTLLRQSFYLCSQTLGVWEGASGQIQSDVSKGYVFPNGAISQAMKTAPDLFAVQVYRWLERGS